MWNLLKDQFESGSLNFKIFFSFVFSWKHKSWQCYWLYQFFLSQYIFIAKFMFLLALTVLFIVSIDASSKCLFILYDFFFCFIKFFCFFRINKSPNKINLIRKKLRFESCFFFTFNSRLWWMSIVIANVIMHTEMHSGHWMLNNGRYLLSKFV